MNQLTKRVKHLLYPERLYSHMNKSILLNAHHLPRRCLSFECICFLDPLCTFQSSEKLFCGDSVGIVTPQTVKEGSALSLNLKNRQLTKIWSNFYYYLVITSWIGHKYQGWPSTQSYWTIFSLLKQMKNSVRSV